MVKRRKLRGTNGSDALTGTARKKWIYGLNGDDVISTGKGRYRAWGGEGSDVFKTLDGARGHLTVMDFEAADRIDFCGCRITRKEQRGRDTWILKGEDVKAVVKGVDADELELNYTAKMITLRPGGKKLRGTNGSDALTGTARKRWIYGLNGDDVISTGKGRYRAWGGGGADTFETLRGVKGHITIMDLEAVDTITFCGCGFTQKEQRGRNVWIVLGDDVKAVIKGVDAEEVNIDYSNSVITLMADPLA